MLNDKSFLAKLLRLKECLGVAEDQDIADALGMSAAAFSARKKRGAFPDEKVFVLAMQRPDLQLDTVYVLTGDRSLQGKARQRLESANRMVGSSPEPAGLLVAMAAGMTYMTVELRAERAEQYERLLELADRMSDTTITTLLHLAERVSEADVVDQHLQTHERERNRKLRMASQKIAKKKLSTERNPAAVAAPAQEKGGAVGGPTGPLAQISTNSRPRSAFSTVKPAAAKCKPQRARKP